MMRKVIALWRTRTEGQHVWVHCVCECGHTVEAPITLSQYQAVMNDPDYQAQGDCEQCDAVKKAQEAIAAWSPYRAIY